MSATRWFAKQGTWEQAYPGKELRGQLVETGDIPDFQGERTHYLPSLQLKLPCRNPRCKGGGVDVEEIVSSMAVCNEAERTHDARCRGQEKSGKKVVSPCYNRFKGSIQLVDKAGAQWQWAISTNPAPR